MLGIRAGQLKGKRNGKSIRIVKLDIWRTFFAHWHRLDYRAICYFGIAAFLLPPVRNFFHAKTRHSLSGKTRGFSIFGLFLLSGVFSGLETPTTADNQSAHSANKHEPARTQSRKNVPDECDETTTITGKRLNVLGSGIDVRNGPGPHYAKIVNQKATKILEGTHYISIGDTVVVYEECTKNGWSWVRIVDPDYLAASHRGWVPEHHLDKGQKIEGDKYARKISSSALTRYTIEGSPKLIDKYGSRIGEIEDLRRRAAEIAADSGKCDYVIMSELSTLKSTLDNLQFWVDCRNKHRIYLDEHQIQGNAEVLTQAEKAWTEVSAMKSCRAAIKERALLPNQVDIHSILGTSYYKSETTHNVVLRMDFDAKNAFGAEFPYTATCYFAPGEVGEIEITKRY